MAESVNIRKTAESVKKSAVLFRGAAVIALSLVVLVGVTYVVSFFYDRFSSFSVQVSNVDMLHQSLSLSETEAFNEPVTRLNANTLKECTNISGKSISSDVDAINGEHNGSNYIAYTFYIKNTGEDALTYEYAVQLLNVTKNIDAAIRIRIYHNGEPVDYAKTKSDGTGPEEGTTEFVTHSVAVQERVKEFEAGQVDKFSVVIWLEGDDPECVNEIIGGRFKAEMSFTIVEGS